MEAEVIARYRVSGTIAGLSTELTVHADGTLRVDGNRRPSETRHVDPDRLQPLVEAFARPEWQHVEPTYGDVVFDGVETTVEGGGTATTILTLATGVPPIVTEVLGLLQDLWPDLDPLAIDAGARGERFPEPDRFELAASGVAVVYQSSEDGRSVRYLSVEDDGFFENEDIDTFASPHGQFVSVQLRVTSAVTHRFSVLLPAFRLAGAQASSPVATVGIRDVVTRGVVPPGPPHRPGQQQEILPVPLRGLARIRHASGGHEPPAAVLGRRWVRSHEEETNDGVEVYRPDTFSFPPSHPRPGVELDRWGVVTVSSPHPLDAGTVPTFGHWRAVDHDVVELRLPEGETTVLRLVEVTQDILRVQREQAIGTCAGWLAVHDREPGSPAVLWVRGTCRFPDAGSTVQLRRHEPQGINPGDLLLEMVVHREETAAQVVTDREVEYREETAQRYETVTILPEGPTIPVEDAF